ncbi:MAG: hypothetical protein Q9175_006775 [Cornicularia normoerica]
MNIFRILADLSHLVSILILLRKMKSSHSCSGISFKSQALYLIVYATRYLGWHISSSSLPVYLILRAHWPLTDIFWTFTTGSVYNTTFKLLFLAAQSYTVYLMLNDYKPTHDPNIDTFKVQYLLGGSAVLAALFPYRYQVTEVGSALCFTGSEW